MLNILRRFKRAQSSSDLGLKFSSLDPDGYDVELCRRLRAAWQKANADDPARSDGLWADISDKCHGEFIGHMRKEQYAEMAGVLANMFKSLILHGLCEGTQGWHTFQTDTRNRLLSMYRCIVHLAIGCGVYPCPSPENGQQMPAPAIVPELLERLRQHFGYDAAPPQVGGLFGLEHGGLIYNHHNFFYLYGANLQKNIAGKPDGSCLEIGGGCGMLAYHAMKNRSVGSYSIIDLPLVNVIQGYLLLKSSIADKVVLYGEPGADSPCEDGKLRVLPTFMISRFPDKSVDMIFNQDSFPEMERETMLNYLQQTVRIARHFLISINQEGQVRCRKNFIHSWVHKEAKAFPQLRLLTRSQYSLRPGYMEELYAIGL